MNVSIDTNILLEAKQWLIAGEVIILPTETVYGIAVDATNKSAIEKIYNIKGRNRDVPLQLMCANFEVAEKYGIFSEKAKAIANKFFPGPLTMVVQKRAGANIADNMNIVNETIGIRIPDHDLLARLLEKLDFPIAISSANKSGNPASTTYQQSVKALQGHVSYGMDNGECRYKIASTVIDLSDGENIKILRQGVISMEDILSSL